jgi:hypothetical protein
MDDCQSLPNMAGKTGIEESSIFWVRTREGWAIIVRNPFATLVKPPNECIFIPYRFLTEPSNTTSAFKKGNINNQLKMDCQSGWRGAYFQYVLCSRLWDSKFKNICVSNSNECMPAQQLIHTRKFLMIQWWHLGSEFRFSPDRIMNAPAGWRKCIWYTLV